MTVTMALEANVGATSRKATLRAVGTAAGGLLAAVCVSATAALNVGWAPGAPPGKVAAITAMVSLCGGMVQLLRARDPAHDYACVPTQRVLCPVALAQSLPRACRRSYVVCLMTLVLAALSDFRAENWRAALLAVLWRLATIAAGGAIAFLTSNLIAPQCALHELWLCWARVVLR
jgi:hypothetical protein